MCFHRDTARGSGLIRARNTLRTKAPTEGTENTYRDVKNSQEALMQSEPCTCRIQTVRRGQVVRTCATKGTGIGTGVHLLAVEQECLLLEADVKHSEVQNLFSLPNAPPPSALF